MSEVISNKKSWENLYTSTQKLNQARSGHEMFSDTDIVSLKNLVKNILCTFLKEEILQKAMKVYIDKELQNHLVHDMAKRPPREDESIEDWCKVIFCENKFGVVFNSLESGYIWSHQPIMDD